MSLEEFYYVSQIIAAFAILASLIYVALQVRQTEKNQRALIHQTRTAQLVAMNLHHTDGELSRLMAKTLMVEPNLSESEATVLMGVARASIHTFEDAQWQHKAGLLDDMSFENAQTLVRAFFSRPVMRGMWRIVRPSLSESFAGLFETQIIEGVALAKPGNLGEALASAIKDVVAEAA